MVIYSVEILSCSMLAGILVGDLLGIAIGVKADVKGEKIFDALDWLAAMCPHVPNRRELWV